MAVQSQTDTEDFARWPRAAQPGLAEPEEEPVSGAPDDDTPNTAAELPTVAKKVVRTPRLVSLDAFRGLTILGMLLVNNIALGGQTPQQLMHAEWSGRVHYADLVMPWFLFIVGVAVPYSAASARRKHLPTSQYDLKALYRALTLFFLGCVLDSAMAHHVVFGLGVLQLIGLAYFTAVLAGTLLNLPGRLVLAALLLTLNWAIIRFVPIPGVGVGHFTPDVNIIAYINKTYLAQWHLNGLLSVIPTTALVLIGTAIGDLLRRKKDLSRRYVEPTVRKTDTDTPTRMESWKKVILVVVYGAGMIAAGNLWAHWGNLPMNKPLWTAPYILYTAGWGSIGLAVMYVLIDATPGRWGQRIAFPLIVPGMNAIVAYVAPILVKLVVLRNITVAPGVNLEQAMQNWCYAHAGRINGGWLYTFGYLTFWWVILLILYKRRLFLKV